jgi:D-alanyl-D-alanine-carboxypeptidase/D-alanyl-D-alanine-endopeptidase
MDRRRSSPRLAALALWAGLAAGARADEGAKEKVDTLAGEFLKDKAYLALVIGVVGPDEAHVYTYGKVGDRAPDANTVFEIGSITKSFTGTLLAEMVLAKQVRLDDPAQKYLPAEWVLPRRDDRDIALLHLATHTSSLPVQPPSLGLYAMSGPKEDFHNPYKHFTSEKLAATLKGLKLERPIGSKSVYSNLGFGLLGHALAGAAKAESYERLVTDRVLKPLKMSDTRIRLIDAMQERRAPGHDRKGERTAGWDFATLEACGGLRSSGADMLKYAKAALGADTPLKPAFAFAQQPWREHAAKDTYSGLGWVRDEHPDKPVVLWHNGGTGGYRSFLGLMPESGRAVVVLSNSFHSVDELGHTLLKSLDGEK